MRKDRERIYVKKKRGESHVKEEYMNDCILS